MVRYLLFYFILYNCVIFCSLSEEHESSEELKNKASSHIIPYSEHENPPEPPTKLENFHPNYRSKPLFINNVSLEFTPNRLYAQVRHRDIVKRLPREHVLNEAKTDEERENVNRLRAVVKKQKINTYYTEEGYEDAAYDHAGHIRDADFDEKYHTDVMKKKGSLVNEDNSNNSYYEIDDEYKDNNENDNDNNFNESVELKKSNIIFPHYDFFKTWEESGNNPRKFTETEKRELERDLLEKNREAADNAETNIPENLKYLADNSEDNISDSDEYNTILSTFNDDNSKENDISNSVEFEKKSESTFRIVAAPINSTLKFFETNVTSIENNMENLTLKSKPLLTTMEKIISASTTPTSHYPSLSQIYETWKRKGIEEKYEESSEVREGEHNLISNEYSSEERLDNASTELEATKRLNKKYVLLVRKPTVGSCNDSKSKDLYIKNKEPIWNNEELTVLRPPAQPLSKQVTYTDFLPKTHDNSIKPSVTQKSGSIVTSNEENNTPPSILIYRYYRQPHYRHQPTWKDLKNYILPSIEMFPPTRTSRSEYAHYNTERRNGNNKPQYNFRPEVLKKRLVFRIGSKTEIRPKYSMDDKKRYYEKVPLKGVKNSYQSISERKLVGLRQKRDTTDLLNDAPKVVEQVINKEIDARFPEDQNTDDNDEKHRHTSIEEIEKEEDDDEAENVGENKKKVEVEVPEFNFFNVNQLIKINNSNKEKMKKVNVTLDNKKYPFYYNNEILRSSPLKYIMNPRQIPHKTLGGSEFYNSRDKYLKCEEIDPDLSTVVPEKEEPMPNRNSKRDLPRLRGLGDKISCYKAKYFDKNPLDNPLFYEKTIESPNIPEELNPFNFIARISHLSADPEENVYRRVSKKPEIIDIRPLESRKNEIIDPDQYKWSQPEQLITWSNHAKKHRNKSRSTTALPFVPYQKLVYENVMDTIKNLTNLYRQHPSTLKSRVKVSSRLQKVKKSPNVSQNKNKNKNKNKIKNHFIYITTQTPDVLNAISSFNGGHHRKFKIVPYRTNKVTYRTRKITRPVRGVSNKTIGYLKTVKVHKRQVDLSDLDPGESKIINVRNNTLRKRYKKPENNTQFDQTSVSAKKIAYTIIDRAKNFNTQETNKYRDFTTESTSIAHITARNEPKYTTIRRFDEDIYKIKPTNNPKDLKKIDERYDVYEENRDEQTENLNGMIQKEENKNDSKNSSDDTESNSNSEQFSGSIFDDDEFSNDDGKADSYEKKKQSEDQVEQVERPYATTYADSNSEDISNEDESDNSENYHEDENGFFTISDHEKDFERYSSRPLSPYQSFNDPKYAELGPRINKPAFYHPSFESLDSVSHDEEYHDVYIDSEEHKNKHRMSKFTFPWHDNDKNISEESKKYKKVSRADELPWERRARLQAMKKEIDRRLAEEHYPLESVIKFEKIYPSEQSMKFRFHKFGGSFWKDDDDYHSHEMSSEIYPTQYNHYKKMHLKSSKEMEEELVKLNDKEQENSTDTVATITTPILQIPATSEKFSTIENSFTTPTVLITTPKDVYTVRLRNRRLGDNQSTKALIKDQTKSESKILISSTPKFLIKKPPRRRQLPKKNYNNNNNNTNNYYYYRRRLRITSSSTTIKPLYERLSNHPIDSTSTTPTTKKIEHRSKVSNEKIITKTTFPLIKQNKKSIKVNDVNHYHDNDDNKNDYGNLKNKVIQKLSIVINKNPEHIFQTREIEENGKKNLSITIKPNNDTQVLSKTKELFDDSIVDNIKIKDSYNSKSNNQESKEIDENLALNDKLQLTEHESKKTMASVSWTSENYDG